MWFGSWNLILGICFLWSAKNLMVGDGGMGNVGSQPAGHVASSAIFPPHPAFSPQGRGRGASGPAATGFRMAAEAAITVEGNPGCRLRNRVGIVAGSAT